jgi:hypothetical protein
MLNKIQEEFSVMLIYQIAKLISNRRMKTVDEIRLDNLKRLKKEFKTYAYIAEISNTAPAYLSQVLSKKTPRNMGEEVARKIETGCKKPYGWMDHDHGFIEEEAPEYANHSEIEPEEQIQPITHAISRSIEILTSLPENEIDIILPLLESIHEKYRKT